MPKRKTEDEIISLLAEKRPEIEYIGGYVNARSKMTVRGRKCGHSWEATPKNLLNAKSGCPTCALESQGERGRLTPAEYEELIESKYTSIRLVTEYRGQHEPITYECRHCGQQWTCQAVTLSSMRASTHEDGCGSAFFPEMTEEAIRTDFALGLTLQVLAEKYGCTTRTISYRLKEYDLHYRKPRL